MDTRSSGRPRGALAWLVAGAAYLALGAAPAQAGYEHAFSFGEPGSGPGQLSAPHGVAVGPDGNLYVADQDNDQIQVFGPDGAFLGGWGSSGSANGQLSSPRGIAVSPSGEVYVVDRLNDRVQVFSSSGTYLRKWGSPGTAAGRFNSPGWVDLDSSGNVYVTDTFNYRVQVFTSQGIPVTQFGSQGAGPGQFSLMSGIEVTGDGVYVADHTAARLQLFSTAGTLLSELGGLTNPGLLVNPWGIAEDTSESLLVAELGVATGGAHDGVSRISRAGAALDAFGPLGTADDELSQPRDVAVGPGGDAYVTDADLSQVKVFTPVGGGGPQTAIESGPSGPINTTSATFTFSSTTAEATFECSVDAGAWVACSSPHQLSGLGSGGHSIAVRALHAGEVDLTPAVRTFTVDLEPPAAPSINTDASDPSPSPDADFSLSGEQGASFECRLDGIAFEGCGALRSYTELGEGNHVFEARQTDLAGNVGETGQFAWRIDLTPPDTSISESPAEWHPSGTATFVYASNEAGSSFGCVLDDSPVTCPAASKTLTGLSEGAHTFTVRAVDAAGNQDPSPETSTFNVDTVAPAAPGIVGPSGAVSSASADFDVSGESFATIECGLDGAALASCGAHSSYAELAQGAHDFRARQTDRAGNVSPLATRSWTVDTVAPATTILTHPDAADRSTSAAFTYSANESQVSFQCRLDGGQWAACAAGGQDYDGLALGAHTFDVRAVDAAANVSAPAFFAWVVVPNAPPEAKALARRVVPKVLYKLDARRSTDAEGGIAAYEWRVAKKSGDPGSIVSTSASPKYRVKWRRAFVTLTVTDADGATGTDTLVLKGR